MSRDVEADLVALAVVEPDEFVAARNARTKELRAAGERDRAALVAKLRKPTWTAWALNLLARDQPDTISSFLAAGAALDDALGRALGGDRDQVRQAQRDERAALADVVDRAVGVLAGAGRRPGDQDRQRLTGTLRAAVTDPEVRARLIDGFLVDDVEAPGFGFGFGAVPDADVVSLASVRAKRAAPARTSARSGSAATTKAGPTRPRTGADDRVDREAAERRAAEEARAEARRREAERLAAERTRLESERRTRARELEARRAEAGAAEDARRAAEEAAVAAQAAVEAAQVALDEITAALDALPSS